MIAWIFSFFISFGYAGYLQIVGESSLKLQKQPDGIALVGDYLLRNQGDETARHVHPAITVDNFSWRGKPTDLQPGQSYAWRVQQKIESSFLRFPIEGRYAVVVFNHYADLNSYPFAIPSVQILTLGTPSAVAEPQMTMAIDAIDSSVYSAQVTLKNSSDEKMLFHPLYVLPREVTLQTPELPLEIPGGGELATNFIFANRTGLVGSSYHAFLILRWVENGQRQAAFTNANFRIENKASAQTSVNWSKIFWAWWLWTTAVGLIGMWALWLRPLRKFRLK